MTRITQIKSAQSASSAAMRDLVAGTRRLRGFLEFGERNLAPVGRIVNGDDGFNVQLQPLNIVHQVRRMPADGALGSSLGRRVETIRLDEHLCLWDVSEAHSGRMQIPLLVIKPDGLIALGDELLRTHRFDV